MAVEDFTNGANILQQVDVSQVFKSLAMGIAEAQKELDDNSISDLQRLSEIELAGKSLLELGFVPAFYSFTHADISASIHLRMAEKTNFELGVAASFDYASSNASESDFSNISKEHQFYTEKGEFKSNRKFSMKSSSTNHVKVNNQYYKLDQSVGCVSKIEKLHDQLLQDEKIERVNIQRSNAYTSVYKTRTDFTVLKLTNFTTSVTGGSVTVGTDFATTFNSTSSPRFGFSGDKLYLPSTGAVPLQLFFDFDKDIVDFAYDQTVSPSVANKDLIFEALATILRMDPSLEITIDGYTDGSGPDNYNQNLSERRCNEVMKWLQRKGAGLTQLKLKGHGESEAPTETADAQYRKVKITLPAGRSYIFFTSALSSPSPTTTSSANHFILAAAASFVVTNGSETGFSNSSAYTSLADYLAGNSSLFHSEQREDVLYLLNKNTEITFMTYSADSENIEIVAEEGSESEIKVYSSENTQERIKNLATKNNSNKTFAASASIDIRVSRQFEISMEGSASMSAHMIVVPAPDKFTAHIATAFNIEETE